MQDSTPKPTDVLPAANFITLAHLELQRLIMSTPTGPARNALCDANIHVMEAEAKLNTAMELLRDKK